MKIPGLINTAKISPKIAVRSRSSLYDKKRVALIIGLVAYIFAAALGSEVMAGYVFALLNKRLPVDFQWNFFIDCWKFHSHESVQLKRLIVSLAISTGVVFGGPAVLVINATTKRRELHGSARFAYPREIKKAGLDSRKGIIIGKFRGRYLIVGGETFVLMAAPTRSSKSVTVVTTNLLNWPDSVLVTDVKLEVFLLTSGFRARNGQAVFLFAPFLEDGNTHRWNPLSFVRRGSPLVIDDLRSVGLDLWPITGDKKTDFWHNLARDLFMGIATYIEQTPALPFTLAEVFRQYSGSDKSPKERFPELIAEREAQGIPLSDYCVEALQRFVGASEAGGTGSSIKATFTEALETFASPMVERATCVSDFEIADVRKRRMTIYFSVPPDKLQDGSKLMNVFFSQFVKLNTKEMPQANPQLKYQCLLCLDEFAAAGVIAPLTKAVGFIAGYGLRLMPIVQSVAQIRSIYKEETDNLIANHDTQIVYAPTEQKDAVSYSETLGYLTEMSRSRGRSRANGMASKGGGSTSENTSPQKRALMLPQEVRELDSTKQLIFHRGLKPILCDKAFYYKDPIFIDRLKSISPSLAALGSKMPTQAQIEHASFILRDLSISVPHQPFLPSRSKLSLDKEPSISAVDLGGIVLGNQIVLPVVDSQTAPSEESIEALVDSFFSQCVWTDSENESSPLPAAPAAGGVIDLSLLNA